MKHPLLKLEPVIWLLFGQGILVGTVLLTGWVLILGIAAPLGIVDALGWEHAHELGAGLAESPGQGGPVGGAGTGAPRVAPRGRTATGP